jgi:hypothetical protein
VDLAEIADMLDAECLHATASRSEVELLAARIGLSRDAKSYEMSRWERRAKRMHAAAQTIRSFMRAKKGAP